MKSLSQTVDEQLMQRAIALARKGRGKVSPNPMVGAVLAVKGRIVAEGFHKHFGGPHAEVECLRKYNGPMKDSTLYVNLEPCAHTGKTAPCVDLLIQRGVRRVVVGMLDPNPLVSGRGVRKLRRAGIQVHVGTLADPARDLNRQFCAHITRKSPYINVKIAQSLDGFIAPARKTRRYITSMASLKLVHKWRSEYDAVLVGAGTLTKDNPLLNVRFARGRNPAVVILDGKLRVTGRERIFHLDDRRRILVLTTVAAYRDKPAVIHRLRHHGADVIPLRSSHGRINLSHALRCLYTKNIGSILVEGGADIFEQAISQGLVDELNIFIAPVLFGHGLLPFRKKTILGTTFRGEVSYYSLRKVGDDILFHCQIMKR